jgi:cell division protease FtsH
MARHRVTEWGMSTLGPLSFGKVEQEMFLGREISKRVDYSELTAQKIDDEVKTIVMDCYNKTRSIVESNLNTLHRIAQTLLEEGAAAG